MSKLKWDEVGKRLFETGVDHGVLYVPDVTGVYATGVPWNGLTAVTEAPSGAESNKQYADNQVYLNLVSAEEFAATIEAFTYPDEFEQFDGSAELDPGVYIAQQVRKPFGLSYRSLVGNDLEGQEHGYKLHLVYGCLAAPSERARATVNDSPEAMGLSWELSTTPVAVGTIAGKEYRPTAHLTIDSTKVDAEALAAIEEVLYGKDATVAPDPVAPAVVARLPLPAEIYEIVSTVV